MGGVFTRALIDDKQKGSVAILLTTSTKQSAFKNGENRPISPETKIHPVRVTHGICGMSIYDPLQAIYFVKGEKQRLA